MEWGTTAWRRLALLGDVPGSSSLSDDTRPFSWVAADADTKDGRPGSGSTSRVWSIVLSESGGGGGVVEVARLKSFKLADFAMHSPSLRHCCDVRARFRYRLVSR
jgi:hypothetical protein